MITLDTNDPRWQPPFCPNPECKYYKGLHTDWPVVQNRTYRRSARPRRIRRYQCKHCGVTFSSQTFSASYYQKRPDILPKLMTLVCGCMSNRQIADHLDVAPTTIDNQVARLGRHCLLFHEQMRDRLPPPSDIAIDGFETFELSQYFPFHFHLAVDCRTSFFLHFTDSPLRRKGRMTDYQHGRREELESVYGRPDPQAVRKDVQELLEVVTARCEELTIRRDGHRSYPPAIRQLRAIVHHDVTSSKERRDRFNRLFEINLLDLLFRHGSANHKRETLAWAKRRGMAALRLAIFLVWRNYVRPRWKKRCGETPAMLLGLLGRRLTIAEILGRRLFVAKVGLDGRWSQYYWGEVVTPALGVNRRHHRKRAM